MNPCEITFNLQNVEGFELSFELLDFCQRFDKKIPVIKEMPPIKKKANIRRINKKR